MPSIVFPFRISVGAEKGSKSLIQSLWQGSPDTLAARGGPMPPCFHFVDDKEAGATLHTLHNLCVKVPFLNATKGQEVVIHQRNYACTPCRAE